MIVLLVAPDRDSILTFFSLSLDLDNYMYIKKQDSI